MYKHTYLHRIKDMSMYKTRPIQTSYTEKEINTCTRYKCLCRCLSMADILPPPHPLLVLHIRTFPPSLPLFTYHQQFSDLVVAFLRCNVQRGVSLFCLRLHIRLARLSRPIPTHPITPHHTRTRRDTNIRPSICVHTCRVSDTSKYRYEYIHTLK
jgi:hypothetical protein